MALLTPTIGSGNDLYIAYGAGILHDANFYVGQVKIGEVGYRSFVWDGLYWQTKVGYWGEGSPDKARGSSAYIATGPGLEVNLQPLMIRSGWGLSAITSTDNRLGGHFPQFNGEFALGLKDRYGDQISLKYEHISSAGIVTPNAGRDFILIELSQEW